MEFRNCGTSEVSTDIAPASRCRRAAWNSAAPAVIPLRIIGSLPAFGIIHYEPFAPCGKL